MSEENNMERMKQLGLYEKEIKQDVKSMSEETIKETIKKLRDMSIEEFNKLLLQPKDTVIDKKFTIEQVLECGAGENCKHINIKFELLFRYIIGGYKTNDHIYNLDSLIFDETNNRNNRLYLNDKTLRRKAGIFHLTLDYHHHTTYCGNSYIGNTMNRTVWSLLVPNYDTMINRGLEVGDMLELFQNIANTRKNYEIKLDNLDEINKIFMGDGCRIDHSDDFCDDDCDEEYCDRPHYESSEEYCMERCENGGETNLIGVMLTHPHFFNGMDNFCTGGQFSENKVLKELQQYPNPITYMAEMIRITNDVEFGDSYYSDRYMCDVFDNWNSFNAFDREVYRFRDLAKYYQANGRYDDDDKETIFPTLEHTLSNNCYCVDCLTFRYWLKEGLKFDPTKLILAEIGEITKKRLFNGIVRFEQDGNMTSDTKEAITTLIDIDMNDSKYHVFDKSPFDQFNAGFRSRNFTLGLFNNKKGTPQILGSSELRDMFKDYNHIQTMINELGNLKEKSFPNEEFKKITEIIPLFKESIADLSTFSIRDYFEAMFTQILVT